MFSPDTTPTAKSIFSSRGRPSILLSAAMGLLFTTLAVAPAIADDPADWRDNSKPELRKNWDKLEGKTAISLKPLADWMQAENGKSWEEFRGKVVLIDYWATWCGPCRAAIPHLVNLYNENHDKGLIVLGIHSSRGFDKMADFVTTNELPYTFAADKKAVIGKSLGIRYIPSYFIVDKRGIMRIAGINRAKIDEVVKTLLAEPYTPPTQDKSQQMATKEDQSSTIDPSAAGWPPILKKNLYAKDFRGEKAPKFIVEEWLSKEPKRQGKILMIDFWATWCGPCRKLIPEVNKFQDEFRDDLVAVGLSSEKDPQVVKDFMAKTEFDYPIAVDPQGRMSKQIQIQGIPHVMIIDTKGIVRWQGFPGDETDPLTADVIKQIIERDEGVKARRQAEKKAKSSQNG